MNGIGDFVTSIKETHRLAVQVVIELKGDAPGHPFRGNQWTGGGGTGDPNKTYKVFTETDNENADILISQGLEPSFKPKISEIGEYAPGRGAEREGTYVAQEGAFSKGSFGKVRVNMEVTGDQLKSPREMTDLGRHDIEDVLKTENGAVTSGKIDTDQIKSVEVYNYGSRKWDTMSREDYLKSRGIPTNIPKLPTVNQYSDYINSNKKAFHLSDRQAEEQIHSYNRSNLKDKIQLASEMTEIPENVFDWSMS